MQRPVSPRWTCWVALCLIACGSPPATHHAIVGPSALKDEPGGNSPPAAVFRTTPPADPDGTIRGALPLGVTFNTCATTDPDEGDALKTTYDFDGDGVVDVSGHCRASRHFDAPAHVRVCVTDRQPGHEACASYRVGGERLQSCPFDESPPVPMDEVEPNGYPDAPMGPFGESVVFSATLTGDGDDYFVFTNTCAAPINLRGDLYGTGGPGDCINPTANLTMTLYGPEGSAVSGGSGTVCLFPVGQPQLPAGASVGLRIEGTVEPGYILKVTMASGPLWDDASKVRVVAGR